MNIMRRMWPFIVLVVLVVCVLLSMSWPSHASTTILSGTIKDGFGNPINGTLVLQLPVPAMDTTTSTAVANTPVTCRLINGAVTGCPPLYDVSTLQPQNLYYIAKAYDNSGNPAWGGNFAITGGTYNLGAAIPTSVTTNNISFVNPAVTNATNTFCCTQNFQGQIVSTAGGVPPLNVQSSLLVPNLNTQILNGVTVTGTPSNGQTLQATGPSTAGWSSSSAGFKLECVNVTPVTVANSVALSPLQTCTIPANDIGLQTFYIDVTGVMGAAASPTLTVGVYLDGTLLGNLSPTTGAITQPWMVRAFFSGLTIGAGGTVTPSVLIFSNSLTAPLPGATPNAPITINTTISHVLQTQIQWGTASVSNTITANSTSVHRIG